MHPCRSLRSGRLSLASPPSPRRTSWLEGRVVPAGSSPFEDHEAELQQGRRHFIHFRLRRHGSGHCKITFTRGLKSKPQPEWLRVPCYRSHYIRRASIQRCLPTGPTLPSHRYTVPSIDFPMALQTPNQTKPRTFGDPYELLHMMFIVCP